MCGRVQGYEEVTRHSSRSWSPIHFTQQQGVPDVLEAKGAGRDVVELFVEGHGLLQELQRHLIPARAS